MIELSLPYPPSVNHYYRNVQGRTIISKQGREYRKVIAIRIRVGRPPVFEGAIRLEIDVHPPDRRRRDLDNILKALLDALQHAGLYGDDSQIDELEMRRRVPLSSGRVIVRCKEIK